MHTSRVLFMAFITSSMAACSDQVSGPGLPEEDPVPITLTKHPADLATASDEGPQDGSYDEFVPLNLGSFVDNGFTSFRTAFEFSLEGVGSATIRNARLTLEVYAWEGTRAVQLHAYLGDGSVQLADFARAGLVGATTLDNSGLQIIEFDVSRQLSDALSRGGTWIGFCVREAPANTANYQIMNLALRGDDPRLFVEALTR